jgi:hypothetical protein
MRYVILRDDDTNALTPVECLERLYRPFLERALPVNLAVIPNVRTDAATPEGRPEGFLFGKNGVDAPMLPIGDNRSLVRYLRDNPGFHVLQHGYHHEPFEFDRKDGNEIRRRLEEGTRLLLEAGIPAPQTFVAPHDKFSRESLAEVARRFRVISTGWFELQRLPFSWWPKYALKKIAGAPHWQVGGALLLSHPGCLLSCHRPRAAMLDLIKRQIESCQLSVLVTHWWEYFRNGEPDEPFIQVLHETAEYLARDSSIEVISFDELAAGKIPLN